MTIKAGEVAFLKTTGEAVFPLKIEDSPTGYFPVQVFVRRPVSGRDGVEHLMEHFYKEELETMDEQRKRLMSEREEMLAKYVQTATQTTTDPNTGFSSN